MYISNMYGRYMFGNPERPNACGNNSKIQRRKFGKVSRICMQTDRKIFLK